jgi:hypothetical protein
MWGVNLGRVDFALVLTPLQQGIAILLFTGVAAPLIGMLFKRVGRGWDSMGTGPFAILSEQPPRRAPGSPPVPVDPAIQAAEVRQMLEAKSERRRRRGEAPLDVEAETRRLLAAAERPRGKAAIDAELRAEVRQLVVVRNDRRLRQGLEPLDIEAETERQLDDFVGSG